MPQLGRRRLQKNFGLVSGHDVTRFVSGHDFSRATSCGRYDRLQPLGVEFLVPAIVFPQPSGRNRMAVSAAEVQIVVQVTEDF